MWMIDLGNMEDFELDPEEQQKNCMWKQVQYKGSDTPGPISHHTSVVYGDKMFLFGGSRENGEENRHLFQLNMEKLSWSIVKPKSGGFIPESRDEHSAVVSGQSMIVFGGFERGVR